MNKPAKKVSKRIVESFARVKALFLFQKRAIDELEEKINEQIKQTQQKKDDADIEEVRRKINQIK